ncbi:MAG: hypothetical protein PHT96_14230 [Syntrophorhabdaceae bacterium]|nr:hypothetical protein [Syntrophorhabdaceae bacterium]MDD4197543.1 hypothetical protein [Syntrophorhabdaceae bacterium]
MADKKYKDARRYYINSKRSFEKSMAGVETGKKAAANAVNAPLPDFENDWKNIEASARAAANTTKRYWAMT